jgi:hypothetical protein
MKHLNFTRKTVHEGKIGGRQNYLRHTNMEKLILSNSLSI